MVRNLDNAHTRRAYRDGLKEFTTFTGIWTPAELRLIPRTHGIAWRKDLMLENSHQAQSGENVGSVPPFMSFSPTKKQWQLTRLRV